MASGDRDLHRLVEVLGVDVVEVLREVERDLLDHLWVIEMLDQVLASEDAAAVLRWRSAGSIEDTCSRGVDWA